MRNKWRREEIRQRNDRNTRKSSLVWLLDKATMTKTKKEKERGSSRSTKFKEVRNTIGIEELRGYYFAHGGHGAGSKFNKTVEKIAEYCRVEVSKEIYQLILYGEEAEFPEVEEPSGSKPSSAKMKKFEMDYRSEEHTSELQSRI